MNKLIILLLVIVLLAGCIQSINQINNSEETNLSEISDIIEETENLPSPPASNVTLPPSNITPPPSNATSQVKPPQTFNVSIRSFVYTPSIKTIYVGDSIRWTNYDTVEQTATADDNSFDTGLLTKGQSETITFNTAGTYTYHSVPNTWVKGKVVVVERQ